MQQSFDSYLRETDEYRLLRQQWVKQKRERDEAEAAAIAPTPHDASDPTAPPILTMESEPAGVDILDELIFAAFLPNLDFFRTEDKLNVAISVPVRPRVANGKWDADSRTVSWSRD